MPWPVFAAKGGQWDDPTPKQLEKIQIEITKREKELALKTKKAQ